VKFSRKKCFHLHFKIEKKNCKNLIKILKLNLMPNFISSSIMANTTYLLRSLAPTDQASMPSLDELLDNLGFKMLETSINIFIFPIVNLMGVIFCSFSLRTFSRPSFEDPIFFYYKLLCLFNIIHLIHNIPTCILFSPRFFPMINTYATSVFNIYYATIFYWNTGSFFA
jgi:hypothetical protein